MKHSNEHKVIEELNDQIHGSHLCTGVVRGGRDGCKGDSGGGLVVAEVELQTKVKRRFKKGLPALTLKTL